MQRSKNLLPPDAPQQAMYELSRRHLLTFTQYMWPQYHATQFHSSYYKVLDMFAKGRIKRLIVTVPPQHGKSLGSSKYLPAYMLGINPDLNIALMSYSTTFARKFNRHLQRVIDTPKYGNVFKDTKLNNSNVVTVSTSYLRNADEFEIVNHTGSFKAIGREGALTGNPVDVMIFDDLYKDAMEGNSPVVRDNVIEMYKTVAETRLHNDSQQLCVFTRWHEDDLIGYFEKTYRVITLTSFEQVDNITDWSDTWVKINYEAIKETPVTELDNRQLGEALYPQRHNIEKLLSTRKADPIIFECMYQGQPTPKEGLLYGEFSTYTTMPEVYAKKNYTDVADTGSDYLCSICYSVGSDNKLYVTDVIYTQESNEITEQTVPMMLNRNDTKKAKIESNNGGRAFGRVIDRVATACRVEYFHQSLNKEARILTNAPSVNKMVIMPYDWHNRWPEFYNHVKNFKRIFKANKHDDAADTLTGIVEEETYVNKTNPIMPQRARL